MKLFALLPFLLLATGCVALFRRVPVPDAIQARIRAAVADTLALAKLKFPNVPLPDSIPVKFAQLRPGRMAASHWHFHPAWGDDRPVIEDITFAPAYAIAQTDRAVSITVRHEVAHLVRRMFDPYSPDDHGEMWARVYHALNGPPDPGYPHSEMHF